MTKIFTIALRHWLALILWNTLVVGIAAVTVTVSPRVWTATTQLNMPESNANLDANLGILGSLRNSGAEISSARDNQLKMQENILTSDALLEQVLAIDPEKAKFLRLAAYKGLFKISTEEASRFISINVSSSSPELAKIRATNLVRAYQQRLNELRLSNRKSRRQFSETELEITRKKLVAAQQALATFKEVSGIVDAEAQIKAIVSTIDNLTKLEAEAITLAEYNQNRVATLSNRLQMFPDNAIRSLSLSENKDYQFLRNKLSELDVELNQKRATFTDQHPSVEKLMLQRQVLLQRMQSNINQAASGSLIDTTVNSQGEGRARLIEQLILAESEASGQQRRARQIQKQLQELRSALKAIPIKQAKLLELQRQVDVAEGVYKGLVAQVQQTNIDVFDVYPNVEIFDPARVDYKPVAPKLSLIVLNAMLGAIIGSVALVLTLEQRNPLLNPQDLQDIKFPIVVSIPRLKMANKWRQGEATEVQFQRLASAVSLQPLKNRHLLITSAIEGEGKTTTAIGLGWALVDLGFRVLLIDADFRQAELTQQLKVLPEHRKLHQPLRITENLDLLPTIPQRGKLVEMVAQGRFERMITTAESHAHYDYVLVDAPPVSNTTVTALMAAYIANVLFVVRPGSSYSSSVGDSFDQLTQHRAHVLGLVVNGVETVTKPYKYRLHDAIK